MGHDAQWHVVFSTWQEDHSFRIRDVLDFDKLKVKHPNHNFDRLFSDLRLGPTARTTTTL